MSGPTFLQFRFQQFTFPDFTQLIAGTDLGDSVQCYPTDLTLANMDTDQYLVGGTVLIGDDINQQTQVFVTVKQVGTGGQLLFPCEEFESVGDYNAVAIMQPTSEPPLGFVPLGHFGLNVAALGLTRGPNGNYQVNLETTSVRYAYVHQSEVTEATQLVALGRLNGGGASQQATFFHTGYAGLYVASQSATFPGPAYVPKQS